MKLPLGREQSGSIRLSRLTRAVMLTQQYPLHEFSKSEKRMDANTNHGIMQ
jgi:hypothetical protein